MASAWHVFNLVSPDADIEWTLKRFKRAVIFSGVIKEMRRHTAYVRPGVRRRRKSKLARKAASKRQRRIAVATEQRDRQRYGGGA